MADTSQPIIIKKIKKRGHGHHGGSWKVAFADFTTAMMAFFLMMWLLGGPVKQETRAAIAEYFKNPSLFQGESQFAGPTPSVLQDSREGTTSLKHDAKGDTLKLELGQGDQGGSGAVSEDLAKEIAAAKERERMEQMKAEIQLAIDQNISLQEYRDQLKLEVTPEGLRIQILDKEKKAMFDSGSPELKPHMQAILNEIAKIINDVSNHISISGHTDATPFQGRKNYTNWELSADRANAARRGLLQAGVDQDRIGRVVGLASTVLFKPEDPTSPLNRRISITILNKETEQNIARQEGGEEMTAIVTEDMTTEASAPTPAEAAAIEETPATAPASPVEPVPPAPATLTMPPLPAIPQVPALPEIQPGQTAPDVNGSSASPVPEPETQATVPEKTPVDAGEQAAATSSPAATLEKEKAEPQPPAQPETMTAPGERTEAVPSGNDTVIQPIQPIHIDPIQLPGTQSTQ
jgi:chemotaxis protein MotB